MGLVLVCASAGFAAVDRSKLLQELASAPESGVSTRAIELAGKQPDDIKTLALDLIFYRWANEKFETDSSYEIFDRVTGALVETSSDPAVGWAASTLCMGKWVLKAPSAGTENQEVKLLAQARQDLRTALDYGDRSPKRSIESLISCADALSKLNLDLSSAFVATRLAEKQLYATHRYRDAEANYERAHPVFTAYRLRSQVARIFDDLGYLHKEVGRYNDAYLSYKASAQEWQSIGFGDLSGKQFINAGLALASDGMPDRALSTMRHGLDISRGYAYANKSFHIHVQLTVQVASFCTAHGLHTQACELLDEAEKIAEQADEPLLLADVLDNQSVVWKNMGLDPRVREALTKRDKVLNGVAYEGSQASEKLSDPALQPTHQASMLLSAENGASAYSFLGKHQQSVDILTRIAKVYDLLKRDDDYIRVMRSLASEYDVLESKQSALQSRLQAAETAKEIGKRTIVVDILKEIEESALDSGDKQTALQALWELVDLSQQSEDVLALASVLESRGTLRNAMGETTEAMRDLERSASIYSEELGEPWSQARVLQKLAGIQSDAGMMSDAETSLTKAIKRMEDWASSEGVEPAGESGRSDTLYKLYLQIIGLELGDKQGKSDAVEWLRKARRYTWFSRLRGILSSSKDQSAAAALAELDKLPLDPMIRDTKPTGGIRKIASGWSAVLSQALQFSRLVDRGRNANRSGFIDAADLYTSRSRLSESCAVIEYSVSDTGIYALIATKTTASYWELQATKKQVQEQVDAFRDALRELEKRVASGIPIPPVKPGGWSDPSLLPVLDPLYNLESMLIQPIRGELSKKTSIVFALPNELSGVPFHALLQDRRGSVKFLIQEYTVSYITPGMLGSLFRTASSPVTIGKCRVAVFSDASGAFPGARIEANKINDLYKQQNCRLYSGPSATAERFVSAASWSNIVHIAAHHKLDPNPAQFEMVLYGKSNGQCSVRLADLMRINNPNLELAVLSACETISTSDSESVGAPYTAEIFALAGFPSVIGGLWKVSDDASVNLMGNFYQNLSSSGKKGNSLQRAQKSMIESRDGKYAHPFYWASFALYGDPR
ncbi:MAG: CHAT domain-containing tetratricopeptide repeat protein [Armatimonadota bacterium]